MTSIRKLKKILLTQKIANEELKYQNMKDIAEMKNKTFKIFTESMEDDE